MKPCYILNIIKNKLLRNILIILSFIILSFISVALFLKYNIFFNNADMFMHFRRIFELKESILNGNIIPEYSFNKFHGSIIMLFYPYINIYPIVFLSFIIKSKITLIYISFVFNIFLSFIISFYSCDNYVHSKYTSYLFSLIYSLSNVFMGAYFSIMDLGMSSAYIFLPLSIFSFMNIIKGKNNWLQLSLGMSLLFLNHILSFLVVVMFLTILLVINFKMFNKSLFIKLLKSMVMFIMITGIFLIPFIGMYFKNFNQILMPPASQHLKRISLIKFVSGIYGAKKPDTLGTFAIIAIFISAFFYKKFKKITKQTYILSLIIVLCSLFFPWEIMSHGIFKIINQFQFAYRFIIIPQLLLTFIFSLIITQYIKSIRKTYMLYIFTILFAIFLQIMAQYSFIHTALRSPSIDYYIHNHKFALRSKYRFNHSYQIDNIINKYPDVYTLDYIPKNALKISHFVNRNIGIYNNNKLISVSNNKYNEFNFNKINNINKISLPIYAYNKEKLHVYLNNKPIKYYANKDGLLTINNINNDVKSKNSVYIKTTLNPFRITGIILFIFSCLIILGIFVKNKFIHFF